jgi:hypothetical protein
VKELERETQNLWGFRLTPWHIRVGFIPLPDDGSRASIQEVSFFAKEQKLDESKCSRLCVSLTTYFRHKTLLDHRRRFFRISGGAEICDTYPSGRQSHWIKMKPTPKAQETNQVEQQCVHSPLPLWIPRLFLAKSKVTTYSSTGFTAYQNLEAGSVMVNNKHSTKHFSRLKLVPNSSSSSLSSSYCIMNLGQGCLFRCQHSRHPVVVSVVVQVVFLLDDILEVVLRACSLPSDDCVGTKCVCMYKVFLLKIWHGVLLKPLRSFVVCKSTLLMFSTGKWFKS